MTDDVALGEEIAEIAGRINVATHRLLTCIRQFDEAEAWGEQGAVSCAHWLMWRVGMDPGTAREKVRVARALGGLPAIDLALSEGKLSYAKVRAMTRVATPENETRVLDVALAATGAQLERICRGFRQATEPEKEQAAERRIRARVLGNGLVSLEIVVSADEADLLIRAIERARADLAPPAASPAVPSPNATTAPRPAAADGLMRIAAGYLTGDHDGREGTPGPDVELIVHLDQAVGIADGSLEASLDDGTHVSAETLRRIACDGGVVAAVVDDDGGVLDIGRRTRAIPTAIRRALWLRDQGCRFPGCTNRRFVHGHHVRHWLHGGRTSLENLVLLCSFHHRLIHEGGYSISLVACADVEVRTPEGVLLPHAPELAPAGDAVEWNSDWWTAGDGFSPPLPTWDGEPVDYQSAVGALAAG